MKLSRFFVNVVFLGGAIGVNSSAKAQNTLDQFLYKTMKLTPARNHSSEFVPGALLEVPLKGKDAKWQVIDNREKAQRTLTEPTVEELTATQDPFQTNKPTNFKIGIDSIKQVFGGNSINIETNFNHEVMVSEIKEKGYVLAGTGDQDLLATGKLHDWLLKNYVTYPKTGVAYFIIKRVYTAQYAEISVDQGFNIGAALGSKDTGTCTDVKLPAAIENPPSTPGQPTATPAPAAPGTTPPTTPTPTPNSPTTPTNNPAASSAVHIGGTFCHPDKEHLRFYAAEWAPLALEVELITRINDTLDVRPGVIVLPLYDNKETAKVANRSF